MSPGDASPEEIEAFVAGELSAEDAERVRRAIATSPAAGAQFEDCLQLRAMFADRDVRSIDRSNDRSNDHPIRAPRRLRRIATIALPLGLAAAGFAWWYLGRSTPLDQVADARVGDEFAGALAPHRSLMVRLSWSAADRHRPYEVERAGGSAVEALPFAVLARVEALRDPRSMFAAQLLTGNVVAADRVVASSGATADASSDRAALAVVRGDLEAAIVAADAALELAPRHPQALWNRAIALERLGLDRSAAEVFDQLAARAEPGWSDEARSHADQLRDQRRRRAEAWTAANTAAADLVAGRAVPLDRVAAAPGRIRLAFYNAVRTAPSVARARALAPVAAALDHQFRDTVLAAYVDRVAASDFGVRGRLAGQYAALLNDPQPAAASQLVTAARAGGAPDIALGAMLYTGTTPGLVAAAALDDYRTLAEQSGDPWFALLAIEQQAQVLLARDEVSAAESVLRAGLQRCRASRLDYRCQKLARLLVHVYMTLHRSASARALLEEARRMMRATNSIEAEDELLVFANKIAIRRDEVGSSWHAVADAYLDEWAHTLTDCAARRGIVDARAMSYLNRFQAERVRSLLASEPACAAPLTADRAFVLAHIERDPGRVAQLRGELARLRSAAPNATQRAFLDHIEGRLLVEVDPAAARVLLRRAIASPGRGTDAVRARSYSFAVLVDDAGRRGAWDEALALLGEDHGRPAAPCTLGISKEVATMFVAKAPDGAITGSMTATGDLSAVPPAVGRALARCDRVDVMARPPYYGRPGLLPADRAWRFVAPARPSGPAGPAGVGPAVVVANVAPPPELQLAALAPVRIADVDSATQVLEGAAANPDHVLAAMHDASYIELHAHGVLGADGTDASFLVLSPDAAGRYALTADAVAATRLVRRPVVVLAACNAAVGGKTLHGSWGLADAFIAAGATTVIASPTPIADAAAPRFFGSLRARIERGVPPSVALRDERVAWGAPEEPRARSPGTDPGQRAWIDALVVFE